MSRLTRSPDRVPPPAPKLPPDELEHHPGAEAEWSRVLERLAEVGVSESAIENWLRRAEVIGAYRGSLCVGGDRAVASWLRRRYATIAGEIIRDGGTFDGLRIYDLPEAVA